MNTLGKYQISPALIFTFVILVSCSGAQNQLEKQIDLVLMSATNTSGPGIAAMVSRGDEIIYRGAFGKASIKSAEDLKYTHSFKIGSLTKQFTAMAILKLVQEGKLSLSDKVPQIVPEWPLASGDITVHHLLTHTSGIKNYSAIKGWETATEDKILAPKEIIDLFMHEPLAFKPGESFYYSNLGYTLLGYMIEIISGKTLDEFFTEAFFTPLNMRHTYLITPPNDGIETVNGYSKQASGFELANPINRSLPYAAGGLVSTLEDQIIWLKKIQHGGVINAKLMDLAMRSQELPNGTSIGYGYGWQIGNIKGKKSIKHDGVINGFVAMSIFIPEEKISVVLMSNCDCNRDIEKTASRIAAIAAGDPFEEKDIQLSIDRLKTIAGTYHEEGGREGIVAIQEDGLVFFERGGRKSSLSAHSTNHFTMDEGLTSFEFESTLDGPVTLTISDQGSPRIWTRSAAPIEFYQPVAMTSDKKEAYVGKYDFPNAFTFEVIKMDDRLFGQVGNDRHEILPMGKYQFFARTIDATLVFSTDSEGRITNLTLTQQRMMEGKRIP